MCAMEMSWLVKTILDIRGWSQSDLAQRLGTTQVTVSRWLAGMEPRGPKRDQIRELAEEMGLLDQRTMSEKRSVRVMGRIGAGAHIEPDYEQVPPEGLYQVELPFQVSDDMIGFQVAGSSQLPFYRDGDVVVVYAEPRRQIDSLIGEEAAVCTAEGKRYIKRIVPGSKRHFYTLVSSNGDPIIDVRLRWASEIVAHVRGRQTRKLNEDSSGETPEE
jgi:transcriptional regulator with XRE-family HTH domain